MNNTALDARQDSRQTLVQGCRLTAMNQLLQPSQNKVVVAAALDAWAVVCCCFTCGETVSRGQTSSHPPL